MSTTLWTVLGVTALVAIWAVLIYGFVGMGQVSHTFVAPIKRRRELVLKLVETVKGYAAHERATLDAVVQARNTAMTAKGGAQIAQTEYALSGALRQLFTLADGYPDLKANQDFQQLQAELLELENKINGALRHFHGRVQWGWR